MTNTHHATIRERNAMRKALLEIVGYKANATRNFTGPSPEDEIDATVLESDFEALQEIAAGALLGN